MATTLGFSLNKLLLKENGGMIRCCERQLQMLLMH